MLVTLLLITLTATPPLYDVAEPSLTGMDDTVRTQLSEALAEHRATAAADPSDAELAQSYGDLGRLYLAYDLVTPAAACLENARLLAPEDVRWPYLLGALYETDRRLDEARERLDQVLALEPDDGPALVRRGRVHLLAGDLDAARRDFERALALGRGFEAAAHAGLGRVAVAQGDPRRAVSHFEGALSLAPEATSLHYPLALAYREIGLLDVARRHLEARGDGDVPFPDPVAAELLELATGAGVELLRGHRALGRGALDEAAVHFRRALEHDPRNAAALKALAALAAQEGDAEAAVRTTSAALAADPADPSLHESLATFLAARGDDVQAARHLEAALALAPDLHSARQKLAAVLVRLGRFADAEGHYRALLEVEPKARVTRFYLAQTLLRQGRLEEAEEVLRRLLADEPGLPQPLLDTARRQLERLGARRP